MVLHWFILAGTLLAVNAGPLMKKLSFDGCKEDSWRVTDISLEPDGDKIHVVADVGYAEKISNKLHQIKLTLLGCDKDFKCTNHTNVVVNDIDCLNKNGTELDREACDVAKTLAEWELETGEISKKSKNKSTKSDSDGMCVHYDTKQIDVNAAGGSNVYQTDQVNN